MNILNAGFWEISIEQEETLNIGLVGLEKYQKDKNMRGW